MEGPVRYVSRIHVDDVWRTSASMAQSLQPSSPSQKTSAADDRVTHAYSTWQMTIQRRAKR